MGAIHIQWCEVEEAARCGRASAGEVVAVRAPQHEVDVRVERTFDRRLPERPGFLARLAARLRTPRAPEPVVRTFAITPPPVATDAFSHPVFIRLAGAAPLLEIKPGDRVFVVQAMTFTEVLRDEPSTRARLEAAFDRTGDVAWASAAGVDELHLALVSRDRADAAMAELRRRRALELRDLLAKLPPDRLGMLQGVVGMLDPGSRRLFLTDAAERLASTGDRAALATLVRSLFDFVPLAELEPLILLLDPSCAEHGPLLEFARVRIGMILKEEPSRAESLARLAAKVGPVSPA